MLRISRHLLKFVKGGVFQTEGAYNFFKKNIKNYAIIPNPIFKSPTIGVKPFIYRNNEIVSVARLVISQKRQDILLKAMSIVVKKYPDIRLSLYGDGPDKEYIKSLAVKLGIRNNVVFHGTVNNVLEKISQSKIFVLCSDYEGISNSLIEAVSIGMPCICTDTKTGGSKLLLEDNKSGFIIPIRNPEILANRIIFYLENPNVADRHGKQAKNVIIKFSPINIIENWEQFISNCCKH